VSKNQLYNNSTSIINHFGVIRTFHPKNLKINQIILNFYLQILAKNKLSIQFKQVINSLLLPSFTSYPHGSFHQYLQPNTKYPKNQSSRSYSNIQKKQLIIRTLKM